MDGAAVGDGRPGPDRKLFDAVTGSISEIVLVMRDDGTLVYVSPSVSRLLGLGDVPLDTAGLGDRLLPPDRIALGGLVLGVLAGEPSAPVVFALRCADGLHDLEAEAELVDLGQDGRGVLVRAKDVTDRVRAERALAESATVDPLTGLPNRTGLNARLEALAGRAGDLSVLLLDLDGFKTVNDSLGHATGDALLRMAAARLADACGDGPVLARLGGDEFAVVVQGDAAAADALAQRLLGALREPFELLGLEVYAPASIGVACRRDDWDAGALLQAADTALYAAKAEGRNRVEVYAPLMAEAVHERLALGSALPGALKRGEMELWFQPMVSASSGEVVSYEALLRWRSPVHGLVSPARFIPLAEESGLIDRLGLWVLSEACERLTHWRERFASARALTVAVNVSGSQLLDRHFPARVRAALAMAELPAQALTIEITESVTLEGAHVPAAIHQLRDIGVRLALDDFGTGYSSLGSMHRLPFDVLKLDRSFVAPLTHGDDRGAAFLRALVGMAHSLDMHTVAEGVETQAHWDAVRAAGVDKVQGYLLGRPAPAADVEQALAALDARRVDA